LVLLLGIYPIMSWAQREADQELAFTLTEQALLDVEPAATAVTLSLSPPDEAGDSPQARAAARDDEKWLNYSCSLAPGASARQILAQVSSGSIPAGMELRLRAGNYTGSGAGQLGVSTGEIILSSTPRSLITGIGGAYTGSGSNQGHQLFYRLLLTDISAISTGADVSVQVTFTITD